jgi:predicted enzyme related to lactoylglutathione lyase
MITLKLMSVLVDDQDKAHKFYTEVLGFVTKQNFPIGGAKWLTVVSPGGHDDVELLLEPAGFEFARTYQKALFDAGIPLTMFASDNVQAEYERLKKLGVVFRGEPEKTEGSPTTATFEDTCGNLIRLFEA